MRSVDRHIIAGALCVLSATSQWQGEESLITSSTLQVFFLRSMLAVPYFEKALYELPEERVTPDELKALADDTERRIQGGLAGRCAAFASPPFAWSIRVQHPGLKLEGGCDKKRSGWVG